MYFEPPAAIVTRGERDGLLGQKGCVVWVTGLGAAGKTVIARALERRLVDGGRACYVLDADAVRATLCSDLGFSPAHRSENVRRAGHVASLLADAGLVVIAAFISPYRQDRTAARRAAAARGLPFFEVYAAATLAQCEARDTKGLYRDARLGKISSVTGIDAPYEPPEAPDLVLPSGEVPVHRCVDLVYALLVERRVVPSSDD